MTRTDEPHPAFEALYRSEYARLVRAVTVAVADRHAAEELVQEVFVQALRHWDRIEGYESPPAWLRRVAAGRAANYRRDRGRRADLIGRLRANASIDATTEPLGAADADLLAAVLALPDRQRVTVALYYLLDQPAAEVAAALDVTEGTVRSQLHAARQQLSRALVPEGGVER